MVFAEPDPTAICEAVRDGRLEYHAQPHSLAEAVIVLADMFSANLRQVFSSRPAAQRAAWDRG
jgi:hypothetical protein